MFKCLVFDCTGDDVRVGVWKDVGNYKEIVLDGASGTESLMKAIDMALSAQKISIQGIEYIGICVGPGSWTGSRVAVATLNGMYYGLKKKPKLFTFDTFDMLAYNGIEDPENQWKSIYKIVPAYGKNIYVKKCSTSVWDVPFFTSKEEFLDTYDYDFVVATKEIFENTIVVQKSMSEIAKEKVRECNFCEISDIKPMYLRESQAEIQLKKIKEGLK